jgi:hypothetical protein
MPTTVFAPPQPNATLARAVTAPSGTIYALNGSGNVVSADVDTPWFLSQGFVAAPTAALYSPYENDHGMARQVTNPNTGNTFTFNGAGFATGITGADLTWFLNQGFVQVPAGTVLAKPPGPSERLNGILTAPSGNSYAVNGRGFVVAVGASDIGWFTSQGFSPVGAGTLLAASDEGAKEPVSKAQRK